LSLHYGAASRYYEGMNLYDLYTQDGFKGLRRLADVVGMNPKYLYQCATGRRTPSAEVAVKLVKADRRLTREDLRPDIFGDDAA